MKTHFYEDYKLKTLVFSLTVLIFTALTFPLYKAEAGKAWPPELKAPRITSINTSSGAYALIRFWAPSGSNGVNVWRARTPEGHYQLALKWRGHGSVIDKLTGDIEAPTNVRGVYNSSTGKLDLTWNPSVVVSTPKYYYKLSAWGENVKESPKSAIWREGIVITPYVSHYIIYRWHIKTGLKIHGRAPGDATSFTDHKALPGEEYKYGVKPVSSDGTIPSHYGWTPYLIEIPVKNTNTKTSDSTYNKSEFIVNNVDISEHTQSEDYSNAFFASCDTEGTVSVYGADHEKIWEHHTGLNIIGIYPATYGDLLLISRDGNRYLLGMNRQLIPAENSLKNDFLCYPEINTPLDKGYVIKAPLSPIYEASAVNFIDKSGQTHYSLHSSENLIWTQYITHEIFR